MSSPRVAAVTIGQTPRPDLLEPLVARAGTDVEIIELGALDGLTADELPRRAQAAYPLTTRLRDGSRVTLDEADLAPLVQRAIDGADAVGAGVTLLLCAGGFADATARGTLVRPFEAAVAKVMQLGARRVTVLVPFEAQADPTRRKWAAAGVDAAPLIGDPATVDVRWIADCHAIVLDYVGHPGRAVNALRTRTRIPVIDLGECGADAAVAALGMGMVAR
ncbi:MAG TPA: AroM family protein [Candidatus Limnocylindrales bacterium]|nr:AroM family protein [Candidatus Limnocylindrales bacterium]